MAGPAISPMLMAVLSVFTALLYWAFLILQPPPGTNEVADTHLLTGQPFVSADPDDASKATSFKLTAMIGWIATGFHLIATCTAVVLEHGAGLLLPAGLVAAAASAWVLVLVPHYIVLVASAASFQFACFYTQFLCEKQPQV